MSVEKLRKEVEELRETIEEIEHEVSLVYCHITDNKISKPNTLASHVIQEADDSYHRYYSEQIEGLQKIARELEDALRIIADNAVGKEVVKIALEALDPSRKQGEIDL